MTPDDAGLPVVRTAELDDLDGALLRESRRRAFPGRPVPDRGSTPLGAGFADRRAGSDLFLLALCLTWR